MKAFLDVIKSLISSNYNFLKLMFTGTVKIVLMLFFGKSYIEKTEDENISHDKGVFLDAESDRFKENFIKNINILKDSNGKNC